MAVVAYMYGKRRLSKWFSAACSVDVEGRAEAHLACHRDLPRSRHAMYNCPDHINVGLYQIVNCPAYHKSSVHQGTC